MPTHQITVECQTPKSYLVSAIAGMFDVPLAAKQRETFTVELPSLDEDWTIGAIVGPSGSGKSTVARHVYGHDLYAGGDWPAKKAVIDCFGRHDAKTITHTLTAVGFSSPPSWIKPYAVLSNGEKFRCDLARALLGDGPRKGDRSYTTHTTYEAPAGAGPPPSRPLVVFDEFTSVVDRTVAKIGSAAVSKAIRKWLDRRFVAVTCHYDVLEWLEPDWVLDLKAGQLARGRLRRPPLRVEVVAGPRSLWPRFARYHYMSPGISVASRMFYALVEGELAAACAVIGRIGLKGYRSISRIVTLPDYQGVGVGGVLLDGVASLLHRDGLTVTIATRHPAMIQRLARSPHWIVTNYQRISKNEFGRFRENTRMNSSAGKALVSAKYAPAS